MNQTDQLAEQLAAPIIKKFRKSTAKFGARNRDSWKRMNRPHKVASMEAGLTKVYAILDRFKV